MLHCPTSCIPDELVLSLRQNSMTRHLPFTYSYTCASDNPARFSGEYGSLRTLGLPELSTLDSFGVQALQRAPPQACAPSAYAFLAE
jgi:hypothetical protein